MIASPLFQQQQPSYPQTMDPSQYNNDTSPNATNNWFPAPTYTFNDSYITPYPTSTVEHSQWPNLARASVPSIPYGIIQQAQQHQQHQLQDPFRPRSSPSTFGPSADYVSWPHSNGGLGIQYSAPLAGPTPVTSTFPPSVFQTYRQESPPQYQASSPPEIAQPQPMRPYVPIASNGTSTSTPTLKRSRTDDDDNFPPGDSAKPPTPNSSRLKRKRTSSVISTDLNPDDKFLVHLKEDSGLPWKDIATRFQTDKGKTFQVAALQMRYKRLREKFRVWDEADLSALKLAHEYWEKYKWEIISGKMLEFGIIERWSARHCARKFAEIDISSSASHGQLPVNSSGFLMSGAFHRAASLSAATTTNNNTTINNLTTTQSTPGTSLLSSTTTLQLLHTSTFPSPRMDAAGTVGSGQGEGGDGTGFVGFGRYSH